MGMKHVKILGLVFGVLVLVGSLVAAAGNSRPTFTASPLTPESTYAGTKSTLGSLAKTDPSLLRRSDVTPVNVLIKYDYDATAS